MGVVSLRLHPVGYVKEESGQSTHPSGSKKCVGVDAIYQRTKPFKHAKMLRKRVEYGGNGHFARKIALFRYVVPDVCLVGGPDEGQAKREFVIWLCLVPAGCGLPVFAVAESENPR